MIHIFNENHLEKMYLLIKHVCFELIEMSLSIPIRSLISIASAFMLSSLSTELYSLISHYHILDAP